ncbi:hypothetical protein C8R44DRAFT_730974 [Mycena epipterygia]|nr:hypothetical protein C8R44DRAFT_730974 [Mycena epipterygia]
MSSASTSTTSLVTVSSRAPLTGTPQKKDFQAAFARLQSTYGFAGSAPSPAPKTALKATASRPTPSLASPAPAPTSSRAPKDFQAAFASLQSTYGFAGAAPSPRLCCETHVLATDFLRVVERHTYLYGPANPMVSLSSVALKAIAATEPAFPQHE